MEQQTINDRYRVVRELGRGGMGCVYLVEDNHRDHLPMALKTMLARDIDEAFLQSFREEFAELSKIRHLNVASNYDFGRITGTREHFFTTEFIDGVDVYKGTQQATFDQILDITAQLLRGLDFLHKHGMLHNDLKPANVLLAPISNEERARSRGDFSKLEAAVFGLAGRVKIIDFGLISKMDIAWDKIRGTPRYMSPERILCQPADGRADLYSLGCVIYLLASRRQAFPEKDTRRMLKQHLKVPPPNLEEICGHLPTAFTEFVHRLLEKRPEDRFDSAESALQFMGRKLGVGMNAVEIQRKTPEVQAGSLLYRERELGILTDVLNEVLEEETDSPCVIVEGESGVGKTRLVEELKSNVQVRGGAFVVIEGTEVEGNLHPILSSVVAGLKTSGASGLERIDKLMEGKQTEGSRSELPAILERIIFWYSRKAPFLIHFDDFHNASDTVRLFVVALIQAAFEQAKQDLEKDGLAKPKLMVVLSRRPGSDRGALHLSGLRSIELRPFTEEDSHGFLRRIYGQDEIPEGVLNRLTLAARGNPQFLLELAKSIVDEGHVRYGGAGWIFPESIEEIPLPTSLRDSMDHRIKALGQDATTVLEWLSVPRTPIGNGAIAHCTLLENERIRLVLKKLIQGGFVNRVEAPEDGEHRYALAYPDLKHRFVSALDSERMAFMHQRMAQAIEQECGAGVESDPELAERVAYHWLHAGNNPGFLRFAPLAAQNLKRCGNFEEAVAYHQRITESLPPEAAAKKIQSLIKLSEMHEFLWDLEKSQNDVKTILKLGKSMLKPMDQVALLRRLASLAISRNDNEKAIRRIGKARRVGGDNIGELLRLSLDAPEAWARWFNGDQERARETFERVEKAALSHEPRNHRERIILIGAQNHVANLHHQIGNLHKTIQLQRRNLELLDELDMEQADAACLCSLGGALLDVGEHEEARELLMRSLEKGKDMADRRTLCRARERLGEYHFLHGDLKNALQITQVGLQDAKSINHLSASANNQRMLGRIYMRADQMEEALDNLKMAASVHRYSDDIIGGPLSRVFLAKLYLKQNQPETALKHLEQAIERSKKFGLVVTLGLAELNAAEAHFLSTGEIKMGLLQSSWDHLQSAGHERGMCDLQLLRVRSALEHSDLRTTRQNLDAVKERLKTVGSNAQKAEAVFLGALADIEDGELQLGSKKLIELQRFAKEAVFPALEQRCKDHTAALRERLQMGVAAQARG